MKRFAAGCLGLLLPVGSLFAQAPSPATSAPQTAAPSAADELKALKEELARTKAELAALKKQQAAAPAAQAAAPATPAVSIADQLPPPPGAPKVAQIPFEVLAQPGLIAENGNGKGNGNGNGEKEEEKQLDGWFGRRFIQNYIHEFQKPMPPILDPKWRREMDEKAQDPYGKFSDDEPDRRGMGTSSPSPPFPNHEWQGYPLPGVPPEPIGNPFMKTIYSYADDYPWVQAIKDTRDKFYGWVTGGGTYITAHDSNTPDSFWILPNRPFLDQAVFRLEREVD
jgi:hypothetical protein